MVEQFQELIMFQYQRLEPFMCALMLAGSTWTILLLIRDSNLTVYVHVKKVVQLRCTFTFLCSEYNI